MRIAIIIPTYNEAGAIGELLAELTRVLSLQPQHEWSVVVVDAHSPDGTGNIVRSLAAINPTLHLIDEAERRGIASAYLTGIRYATEKLKADAFIEFDGDGQHDPNEIPTLVAALAQADCVVGSRYVAGGSIPAQWTLYRKTLSRFGSLYTRLLLELPVHDTTSGFKATRIKGFGERLPKHPEELLSRDYAYKMQFLTELFFMGARIAEVPIHFRAREHDTSKSTVKDIFESLRVTAKLRMRRLHSWRLFKVLIVGGLGFVLQSIIFEILGLQLKLVSPSTAIVLGGEFVILCNFILNDRFSFRDKLPEAPLLPRLFRFHLISFGSVAAQWIFILATERLVSNEPMVLRIAFLCAIALGFLVNYAGYYFYVWREPQRA